MQVPLADTPVALGEERNAQSELSLERKGAKRSSLKEAGSDRIKRPRVQAAAELRGTMAKANKA